MMYFFSRAEFENRISAKRAKRIFDDNRDGTTDTDPLDQLRADATSKVRSFVEPMGIVEKIRDLFDEETGELLEGNALPPELVRLSLDVGVALATQRFPEVMRQDWVLLMKQADADLCKLRDGKTSLGGEATSVNTGAAETELHGGTVGVPGAVPEAQTTNDPCVPSGKWADMGDFG